MKYGATKTVSRPLKHIKTAEIENQEVNLKKTMHIFLMKF